MSLAASQSLDLTFQSFQMDKSPEFLPEVLKAPFLLRCAAAMVDYMILLAVPILWLFLSTYVGDGPASVNISVTVWMFTLIVWLVNFLALPLFRGQTVGKMFAGITVVRKDGRPVRLGAIVLRNVVGYLLTLLTLGIGFFVSALNRSGRSLHDFVAGTVVIRAYKITT
jgi:uncharacterized RDD family membrane protein YckC